MAGFIDIACNFTHPSFAENLDQVLEDANNVDVNKFVLLCASLRGFRTNTKHSITEPITIFYHRRHSPSPCK